MAALMTMGETRDIIGYQEGKPNEALQGPNFTAPARNVRPNLNVYPKEAPEPIRQSDTPSRWAKYPIATFQNVAGIKSVMRDYFGGGFQAPNHTAAQNVWEGGHSDKTLKFKERSNIERDPSIPYGSLFSLSADQKYAYLFGK